MRPDRRHFSASRDRLAPFFARTLLPSTHGECSFRSAELARSDGEQREERDQERAATNIYILRR